MSGPFVIPAILSPAEIVARLAGQSLALGSSTFAGTDPGTVSAGQVAIGGGVVRAAGAGVFGGDFRAARLTTNGTNFYDLGGYAATSGAQTGEVYVVISGTTYALFARAI